jgi:hypothetical protein
MKIKNLLFFAIIIILIVPAVLPLFQNNFFHMHDYTHAARLIELDRGLKAGQIPARWSNNFGWGYGMPLLHFYAPLVYYLAEIPFFLGLSAVFSIKLIFWLNFLLGFIFMYLLAKEFFGKFGGFLSALAFIYAPYRAVQFYVRGALAEMMAVTFLPLALWGIYKVIKASFENQKIGKWIVVGSLGIAGVFLSHNVVTLISIPFLILWSLIWLTYFFVKSKKIIFKKTIPLLLLAIVSLGLSVWFLLPAFFEKDYTIVGTISGGYSYYKLHFIYLRQLVDPTFRYGGSILGPKDDISFQLGLAQISLLIFSGILFLTTILQKNRIKVEQIIVYLFSGLSLLISMFLMTFHSSFIWEKINILHMAQFPWRFLCLAIVFVSLLIGFLGKLIETIKNPKIKYSLFFIITGVLIVSNFSFFKPEKYVEKNSLYYTDAQRIQKDMSGTLKDYLPIWANQEIEIGQENYQTSQDIEVKNYFEKTGFIQFDTIASQSGQMTLSRFYFPGWTGFIGQQKVELGKKEETGFIKLNIPKGEHNIKVKLIKTQLQFWSDLVSLVFWLAILSWTIKYFITKNEK